MKKPNYPSLQQLAGQNPEKSYNEILEEENLIAPKMVINKSVFKNSLEDKKELSAYKKYHKQHGMSLNTQNAKKAFVAEALKFNPKLNFKLKLV
jgi:hypothetical protein